MSPLASSQYKLNNAPLTVCFSQSFIKFPMKPRSLHFQHDFTIKIIYSNIKRYIKREKNKLIASALYLIPTLFCKQCWQYCHYIWDFREIKKNTYHWLQVKSVSLKTSGYAAWWHRQLLCIKFYSERDLSSQESWRKSMQSSLACNTAPSFIRDGRRKGLVDVSHQCSSYTRTVSCILMSTVDDSIPLHHVPFLAPRISKPTSFLTASE